MKLTEEDIEFHTCTIHEYQLIITTKNPLHREQLKKQILSDQEKAEKYDDLVSPVTINIIQENKQLKEIVEKIKQINASPVATTARYYHKHIQELLTPKEKK